ncbi:MAG: chromosomal replication initiator protein DnaA [Thermoleophilaceae bacterium]
MEDLFWGRTGVTPSPGRARVGTGQYRRASPPTSPRFAASLQAAVRASSDQLRTACIFAAPRRCEQRAGPSPDHRLRLAPWGEGFCLSERREDELDKVWGAVREELRADVADFTFHIWLEPLELAAIDGATLHVRAPDHIRTWVRDRYGSQLVAAARRGFRTDAGLEIVATDWAPSDPTPESGSIPAPQARTLIPKYTFEQFVIGKDNRFAHAAALAVAEQPGHAYNPLFIHGRPGLGKTHLLHAIGNYIERHESQLRVRYVTVEEFTNAFITAVQSRSMTAFKESFRNIDVLLLDDVQFLAEKAKTEEELFHTFNALRDSGKQLVMTSDRAPEELDALEERLGERFGSGLVVSVAPPDLQVRRAILAKRAHLDDIDADGDLLAEIAGHVSTSVRALEAALIQVVAYASLRDEPPTPALARRLLGRLAPARTTPCSVASIAEASASAFGVEAAQLMARDRRPAVSRARKVAMYLTRELTGQSLPEIGRGFGGRDHSTVLSAVRSVSDAVRQDPELALTVESLKQSLAGV